VAIFNSRGYCCRGTSIVLLSRKSRESSVALVLGSTGTVLV
jgi:hypothetical protein